MNFSHCPFLVRHICLAAFHLLLALVLLSSALPSCKIANKASNQSPERVTEAHADTIKTPPHQEYHGEDVRGIYYWKTTFNLSDWDQEFLREHEIKRIYMRLFDVVYDFDYDGDRKPVPQATIRFNDPLPEGVEIVPVVYITLRAMERVCPDSDFSTDEFAYLLYKRIKAMAVGNGFSDFREVQLDCDWTVSTKDNFFSLCVALGELFREDGVLLSSTIRLHQLRFEPPPVDKGVLMLYNTGAFYKPDTKNSILDKADVEPYFSQPVEYDLPLSLAFPVFSWSLQFDKDGYFIRILHYDDFGSQFRHVGGYTYTYTFEDNEHCYDYIGEGDRIRHEAPDYSEIQLVKELVTSRICSPLCGNVIYHLDSLELSRFTKEEIDSILR